MFCENIRMYEGSMYALVYSLVRNESDAAEIISESIYRAYAHLDTLRAWDRFKPWILRIAHNTAVEMMRRRSAISLETVEEASDDGNENELIARLDVCRAVNSLKEPYRTVIQLFYYESLSVSVIAGITGSSIPAVKQQLTRARRMLMSVLQEGYQK